MQHANHTNQQLVDRGANGGLAGSDMRVIHKTHRKINIQGIDNHEVTGLDVVTAATLLNTSQVKVIGIFNEYAYLGKGSSIHSSGQLEWFKTNVDEKPVQALEGTTPDISFMPHFSFYEPVCYRIDSSEPDLNFPSSSNEKKDYWVSFTDNQGDCLTQRILTEDTQKIIICSGVRSALRTTTNQCLASPSGDGTTLPFPIRYPQQSTNSLPLDPLDESTPNFEQFVKSQSGEDEDNPIHMANIDIPNLLGRSFLLPPEDNGECHMAKVIDIDDHGQPLEDIKFKLKINKD